MVGRRAAPTNRYLCWIILDCADDGRHAKMEEWKGARAGRRGIRDVSNERAETRLIEKSYTDEEIAAIAQKHKIGV